MYKRLLTFRYLRRKLIPWFALMAVTLCTAMVIIVGSVMGGFLDMVQTAGKSVMGDVVVACDINGFAHYDELIKEIEALPEARAATAVVNSYGLFKMFDDRTSFVEVVGINGKKYSEVTDYENSMVWSVEKLEDELGYKVDPKKFDPKREAVGLKTQPWSDKKGEQWAVVPGIEISPYNTRDKQGQYHFTPTIMGTEILLTVMPLARGGTPIEPKVQAFVVVNELHSGFYLVDSRRVYMPFKVLQRMMMMDEAPKVAIDDPTEIIGTVPGRCSELHIAAAEGVTPEQLRDAVKVVYAKVSTRHKDNSLPIYAAIVTWRERQQQYISAIEHEKGLLTVLFGFISIVAVVMIAVIFYMIVLEKTRDIGILRSLGASEVGIASIFLAYGVLIGILGASAGTLLAWLIAGNINAIHEWLGTGVGATLFFVGCLLGGTFLGMAIGLLIAAVKRKQYDERIANVMIDIIVGIVLAGPIGMIVAARNRLKYRPLIGTLVGTVIGGATGASFLIYKQGFAQTLNENISFTIWDKQTYLFDEIPTRMDPYEIGIIFVVAVVASVIGAFVPAAKAAIVDPIQSLRYE